MLGVPLPTTLFSMAYSCSDMNKGSMMPTLLWGVSGLHAVLHLVRHAGPSEDAFHKRMDLAAIQKRCRWGSPQSVVRYEKDAKLASPTFFGPWATSEESPLSGSSIAFSCHTSWANDPPSQPTQCGDTGLFLSLRTERGLFLTLVLLAERTSDSRYRLDLHVRSVSCGRKRRHGACNHSHTCRAQYRDRVEPDCFCYFHVRVTLRGRSTSPLAT